MTIKTVLQILAVIAISLFAGWAAIWNGIHFFNHKWMYSNDTTIKAAQYLLHGIWGTITSTSPVWWALVVFVAFKKIIKP